MSSRRPVVVAIMGSVLAIAVLFYAALHSIQSSSDRGRDAVAKLDRFVATAECVRTVNAIEDAKFQRLLGQAVDGAFTRDIAAARVAAARLAHPADRAQTIAARCPGSIRTLDGPTNPQQK